MATQKLTTTQQESYPERSLKTPQGSSTTPRFDWIEFENQSDALVEELSKTPSYLKTLQAAKAMIKESEG